MVTSKVSAFSEGFIDLSHDIETLNEAEFSFLPKFKKDPALKEYDDIAKSAEQLLNDENISSATGIQRIEKLYDRISSIYANVISVGTLISCITIIGIVYHLFMRLIDWCIQEHHEATAVKEGHKIYDELMRASKECKDKSKAKVFEEKANKIKDAYMKVEKNQRIGK